MFFNTFAANISKSKLRIDSSAFAKARGIPGGLSQPGIAATFAPAPSAPAPPSSNALGKRPRPVYDREGSDSGKDGSGDGQDEGSDSGSGSDSGEESSGEDSEEQENAPGSASDSEGAEAPGSAQKPYSVDLGSESDE